jgi:hypothetical protein
MGQIEVGPGERKTTMKVTPLPSDADALLAFAETIATVLSEKRDALGSSTQVEALLRASIAAASFATNRYLVLIAAGRKSPAAQVYLAEARRRCYRSVEQLRRRVTRSIAHLCRLMDEKDLLEYVATA